MGEQTDKNVMSMKESMMHVHPVDYTEGTSWVTESIQSLTYDISMEPKNVKYEIDKTLTLKRRSARKFSPTPLSREDTRFFMDLISQAPPLLEPYSVIVRSELLDSGLYLKDGTEKIATITSDELSTSMVDQHWLTQAGLIVILTSKVFSPESLMQAGSYAHRLSLLSEKKGLGMSGIGAFYDGKVQRLLSTQNAILYVCAIGTR